MEFITKEFNELTVNELYEILKSREEVFLLEQNIICQDMDDTDKKSLHCFIFDSGRVIAYLRAYCTDEGVAVGRVLTLEHKKGLGKELMVKSMDMIKKHFNCSKIYAHAQKQAEGFYKKLGFETISDEYLEAGIVHVIMVKNIQG